MDPSARFFTKLRNLAVSLETKTASLQHKHQNFDEDGDVSTEVAVRVLHELHSEVRTLKGQVPEQLASEQARETDTRSFIKACMVLKQRTTDDIQRLQRHYEMYGYQAPKNTRKRSEDEAEMEAGEENQEAEGPHEPLPLDTPEKLPAPLARDPMRTPQLSDYGLSEIHLTMMHNGMGRSAPSPVMPLPLPAMAMQPPMPKTPKCALRMDDDDLQSPCIDDFGISEHTLCLNNDFTMDLHRKKPSKTASDLSVCSGLGAGEPPILPTPPSYGTHSPATNESPEVPAFETPYINRLLKKAERENDAPPSLAEDGQQPPASSRPWERDVPETSVGGLEDGHIPEMPKLESLFFSLSKRSVTALPERSMASGEPPLPSIELGSPTTPFNLSSPTQQFTLSSPRVRHGYEQLDRTPETPSLSFITQDICKLVSQVKKPSTALIQSHTKPTGKENRRGRVLALLSEREYLSLPSYLRQVPLSSLNQVVQRINSAVQEQPCGGDSVTAEFLMEDLKRITGVDTKAPVYFLCLTELKRLEHVEGTGAGALYRLVLSHT